MAKAASPIPVLWVVFRTGVPSHGKINIYISDEPSVLRRLQSNKTVAVPEDWEPDWDPENAANPTTFAGYKAIAEQLLAARPNTCRALRVRWTWSGFPVHPDAIEVCR
jgi:hypothetical protein